MRAAIIGSGTVIYDLSQYVPEGISELIICGDEAEKIERWARKKGIPKLTIGSGKPYRFSVKKLAKAVAETADIVIIVGSALSQEAQLAAQSARKAGKTVYIHITQGRPLARSACIFARFLSNIVLR